MHLVEIGEESLGIADADGAGAADSQRLEVLATHESAVTAPAGLVILVGGDTGPAQLVLTGRADGEHLGVGVEVRAQGGLYLRGEHAGVFGGRHEDDLAVLDGDHDRL